MTRPPAPEPSVGEEQDRAGRLRALAANLAVNRPIALVGMPGAGKTTMGRRLAAALSVPFKDADQEIQDAAGCTIQQIFDEMGEAEFRRGEQRVIARLMRAGKPVVLATGGGAYMSAETRRLLRETAITIWLRADLDLLVRRVEKKDNRPLLRGGDRRVTLQRLMNERHPFYGEADIIVDVGGGPHNAAIETILRALQPIFAAPRTDA